MADLPNQIFALLSAYVSMQRIEAYLKEDEVEDWASSIKAKGPVAATGSTDGAVDVDEVGFVNAAFRWHSESGFDPSIELATDSHSDATLTLLAAPDEIPAASSKHEPAQKAFLLGHLNIIFPSGRLSLITGSTGSGKSSMLAALLGEMDRVSGTVHITKGNHTVAYAGQFPFLEHATIRENILYHTPFDKNRYGKVLEACALGPDLAILDVGDQTGPSSFIRAAIKR